ncbi:hypothetical protein N7532_010395 [Penicillium argentinense]|uniref:Ubiquitin-like domain-containing protein n=1 Tax=Penicillium argentinense TaxID=1131581 RepID=A0A9W9EPN5_9EURO|nr:uncharacterized protein N7532_010395 [Penicillium argentinense]KAJ5085624.1 hypothetical protein N7532_010395 [Penicillium argentinense]
MRSFFKKPEWASKSGDTQPEFYRRSEQIYSDIVATNRAAHRKTKSPPDTVEEAITEDDRCSKRPRLPENYGEVPELTEPSQFASESDGEKPPNLSITQDRGNEAQQPLYEEKQLYEEKHSSTTAAAELPDSDLTQAHKYADRPSSPVSSASHQSRQNADPAAHQTKNKGETKENPPEDPNTETFCQSPNQSLPEVDDTIVQILITSEIPNSRSLIVHRKMSQGLRDVRVEWCKRQGIPTEMQSSIYLTWRGRRLFDVTTCRSLGVKAENNRSILGFEDDTAADPEELRIHMVATTENTALLHSEPLPFKSESTQLPPQNPEDEPNQQIKLILRSPGLDDFKIKARPKTMVSKLISVFRSKQNVSADQNIFVIFDGDRLDPDTCLREHDIANLDMLEVQVKKQV